MNCNDCFNKTKKKHLTERKDFSKQIKELMKNLQKKVKKEWKLFG